MKEFSSISVSSYEATSLADQLNGRSAEGWELEAVVPAGANIVALLSREVSGTARAATTTASTVGSTAAADRPAVTETDATTSMATTVMGTTTAAATTATAGSTASSGAAPAGWYPDPAGRYELRYWDGSQWTEHVSRAGQQYTDPPVA